MPLNVKFDVGAKQLLGPTARIVVAIRIADLTASTRAVRLSVTGKRPEHAGGVAQECTDDDAADEHEHEREASAAPSSDPVLLRERG